MSDREIRNIPQAPRKIPMPQVKPPAPSTATTSKKNK